MRKLAVTHCLLWVTLCGGEKVAVCIFNFGPFFNIPERAEACPASFLDAPFDLKVQIVRDHHDVHVKYVFANFTFNFDYDDEKEKLKQMLHQQQRNM
ncbi:Vitamin B12-binding protein [Frankliniella fusca]|uniref:Vitamin B12-binding protein n=1 Tax=Frankliniella fusca TaxID=407009 RepID=A0AAE1LTI4_9NEOP|nr:Vitamin B12-binding protein [Frankliniella fusca]